jgi:fluoride exporter
VIFTPEYSATIFVVLFSILLTALLAIHSVSASAITYRTMMYATLCAPAGALLRWYLSGYNGSLPGSWSWLPAGTLAANVLGSVLSIALISAEYVTSANGFWFIATLRAVKVGFSGSLTTVSTFVSEVNGFMKNPRMQDQAYIYMVMSLGMSCILSVLMYTAVVYGSGRY